MNAAAVKSREPMRVWRLARRELVLDRVYIMGILNTTPDSFSDGGKWFAAEDAVRHAAALERDGADIIDIGAQSTRPSHTPISAEEEWHRLEPVLKGVRSAVGVPISVDTYYPYVAERALENGAEIINDITGFILPEMRRIAAVQKCGCVVMDSEPSEDSGDITAAVRGFFERRCSECVSDGISPESIVLDCGIGFGKTRVQEYTLLHRMGECRVLNLPILAAASRKRVIAAFYCPPDTPPELRDEASFTAHNDAIRSGAQLVRVHSTALYRRAHI